MSWSLVYLVLGILCLLAGVWRLARSGSSAAFILGALWFLTVLFQFYAPKVYGYTLIKGVPDLGRLIHYAAVPLFIIILLLSKLDRR